MNTSVFLNIPASVQTCTSGFLDLQYNTTNNRSQLVPLLGRQDTFRSSEQWIFPNLSFTCNGLLTKWTFRGVSARQDVGNNCRLLLTIWRQDTQATYATLYRRISTTEDNIAGVKMDNQLLTYTMIIPAQVQSGDIVGIGIGFRCAPSGTPDNVLSLNVSRIGSNLLSYYQPTSGSAFYMSSTTSNETNLIPLIKAVISKFYLCYTLTGVQLKQGQKIGCKF